MENIEFDKILRDRLEGVTEAAPDVWEGISQGLARRHRRVVMRRFSMAAVAAAAGLAIALLVIRDPRDGKLPETPVRTAHALQEEMPRPVVQDAAEVLPIQKQIAAFTRNQVTAQAVVNKPADMAVVPQTVSEEETVATVETPAAEDARGQDAQGQETQPTQGHQLTEADLPAGYWTTEDETVSRKTHTSNISILSNITTVGSDNDLIYKASPMHSSSQTGNRATSMVEPYSDSPKFFSPLSLGLQVEIPIVDRLFVSTGLTYSYLVSQYDMLVDKVLYEGAYNQLHYVGIPLTLSYRFVETPHFGFYGSAGAAAEKCVSQRYVFGSNVLHEKVGGLQWSARVGVGAEYWFVPRFGLYFDPSLVYFFDNSQPFSIRTQQPLQARFEVGLRFKL